MQSERELKVELEHSYSILIRATPAQVWQALTDSSLTTQYYFDSAVESDWRVGSDYRMTSPDGTRVSFEGTILALEPERRLVQSVHIKFHPAFLAHEECDATGEVLSCGGGRVARVFVGVTPGCFDPTLSPESVRDRWDAIQDEGGYAVPRSVTEELALLKAHLHAGSGARS